MQLTVSINDNVQDIEVPPTLLEEASGFFTRMDSDMDNGYQMSRVWVDHPSQEQRCQIVADHLLTALSNGKQHSALMMAAYILHKAPHVTEIHLNTEGDMTEHAFVIRSR
ncbi:MAG: hypothetical protein ACPGSM_16285 [Thiolinea sp.]